MTVPSREAGRTASDAGSPAVRRLSALLAAADIAHASDVHFEPARDGLRVRVRVDGRLADLDRPPAAIVPALMTRIRLLARVDLAERRLPQDGRFSWRLDDGGEIDVRAAFVPAAHGEKITLRLLRRDGAVPDLAALGLPKPLLARLLTVLSRTNGMVVVAGPTGSGKSTTLHACLTSLSDPSRSIATVEDPVEFDIAGATQVAVDEEVGRTFAVVLRAMLRQDPDVLMVGEIRDDESARIACRAALTGHLVLTSLHASSAGEALLRLPEIGVPDYLVRATVSLALAQRLVRRLCPACATRCGARSDERELFVAAGLPPPSSLARATGCSRCRGSGYAGRFALFEAGDPAAGSPPPFAAQSLGAAGLARAALGDTTVEEVLTHCPHRGGEEGA